MNRVILCGRLAGRPQVVYTPCGIPVARLLLRVPRQTSEERIEEQLDEIECFAFYSTATRFTLAGEPGLRVNLEGRLLPGVFLDESGTPLPGCHVWVERASLIDPLPQPTVLDSFDTPPRETQQKEAA